jgi:Fe-S cluster assembly scaffold protein SufB
MKPEFLDLKNLKEETTKDIKKDTLIVLKPIKKNISRKIRFNLVKEEIRLDLISVNSIETAEVNLEIEINHLKKNTQSEVKIRSILEEGAEFNFKGNIIVPKSSENVTGNLDVKGLSVGKNIIWKVKPNLEIANNDIQVKHKAGLVHFSDKQITYLTSRGLSQKEAIKELKRGFIFEVLEKIPENKGKSNIIGTLNL